MKYIFGMLAVVIALCAVVVYERPEILGSIAPGTGSYTACTMEAKICPDGTAVGRSGPNCEFAACPDKQGGDTSTSGAEGVVLTTGVGVPIDALGEQITASAVLDDSRCPTDVQCIWAGTVHARVVVKNGLGTSTSTLELGVPMTTEAHEITLIEVHPAPISSHTITKEEYRLTFRIRPR